MTISFYPFERRFILGTIITNQQKKEKIFTNDCVHGTLRNVCVDVEELDLMMGNEQIKKKKKNIIRKLTGEKPPPA